MSDKRYRGWDLDQAYLLPPSLRDWLPEDHLVYRVLELVESLDLGEVFGEIQEKDPRGTRPYHPRMMVSLLLYGYCVGVYSSRKLAQATYDSVPFRVLTAGQHPHFTVINEFRTRHRGALEGLFVQVLELCRRVGMVQLGHVSVDGSKVAANASKHKAMSYARMGEQMRRLEQEVAGLLDRAEAVDAEEDRLYGEGKAAEQVPEELRRREARLARLRQAKAELEAEAAQARAEKLQRQAREQRRKARETSDATERKRKLTRAGKADAAAQRLLAQVPQAQVGDLRAPEAAGWPKHRVPTTPQGTPTPKAQRNFTDPDSRIMKRNGTYLQGYNCQIAVDAAHQIVLAQAVTNQAPDQEHFIPLLEQAHGHLGRHPRRVSGDAGYYADTHVTYCQKRQIDPYLAVARTRHGPPDPSEPEPEGTPMRRAMAAKLRTEGGRSIYGRRKAIVEPVFGQIKGARGFRRFSLRGLEKVRSEWTLVTLCHNLLKLLAELQRRGTGLQQALAVS